MNQEEQDRQEESAEVAQLYAQVELGLDAAQFLSTPVGRALAERAEARRHDALEALAKVDPEDARTIRALQNEVVLADSFGGWLAEIFEQGRQAHNQLTTSG